jgi:cell division protein FtsQ
MAQARTSLASLMVILVILMYLFLNSSYFTASELKWTGLVLLSAEQLDEYVNFQPANVLRLDKWALQRRLEEHPWVERASVRWSWPNNVEVMVSERMPLAWIAQQDRIFVLDKTGVLMTPPQQLSVLELPQVVNIDLSSTAQLKAAARVLLAVPPAMVGTLAKWDAAQQALVSKSGVQVLMGDTEDLELKFLLLEELWHDLADQGIDPAVIDLRIPKNPVVRPR